MCLNYLKNISEMWWSSVGSILQYQLSWFVSELPVRLVLIMLIISTDEDPSLRIESFAIINLRGVFIKLN